MKNLLIYLVLGFALLANTPGYATNPVNVQAHYVTNDVGAASDEVKIFSKVKTSLKKSISYAFDTEKAKRFGLLSLILGILSIGGWGLVAFTNGWMLIFIAVCAIAGDVFSIMTLWNTRQNRKENRTARRTAWWGLILSLLTGLAPLALLGLVLASL